ncbi:MAG: hypothetical protein V4682_00855 [Patescibacteria group bacterium]
MNVHERINRWFGRYWFFLALGLVLSGFGGWKLWEVIDTFANNLNPDATTAMAGIFSLLFLVPGAILLCGASNVLRRDLTDCPEKA